MNNIIVKVFFILLIVNLTCFAQNVGEGLESISTDKQVYFTLDIQGWAKDFESFKVKQEDIVDSCIKSYGLIPMRDVSQNTAERGCFVVSFLMVGNSTYIETSFVRKVSYKVRGVDYFILGETWRRNILIRESTLEMINRGIEDLVNTFLKEYLKQNFLN